MKSSEAAPPPAEGRHRHQCSYCGEIWEHADSCRGDWEAHRCPACRHYQWHKMGEECCPYDPSAGRKV